MSIQAEEILLLLYEALLEEDEHIVDQEPLGYKSIVQKTFEFYKKINLKI